MNTTRRPARQRRSRGLVRELAVVVVLKLLVLAGLWWWFVKDQHLPVEVTSATLPWMPAEVAAPRPPDPQGPSHDQ